MGLRRAVDNILAKAGYVQAATVPHLYDARRDKYGPADAKGGGELTFAQLDDFADHCDAVSNAVRFRQAQILTTPMDFRSTDDAAEDDDDTKAQVALAREFASTEGGLGGPTTARHEVLSKLSRDLLVLGCCAAYRRKGRGGQVVSVEPINAATIKPLVNDDGWPKQGDEIAFEQWVGGRKVGEFTAGEIHYRRMDPRTSSRWGRSPVEYVANAVRQYVGYDAWNLSWVTDGDGDFGHWACPKDTTPGEREQFNALIRAMNETSEKRVRGSRSVLLAGFEWIPRRQRAEAEFEKTQLFLIRRIAAGFQVNASVLGFAGEQYKVSQGEQVDLAEDYGGAVFKFLLGDLFTDILRYDLGLEGIEAYWDDADDQTETLSKVISTAGTGYYTPNEGRRLLGQKPAEGPYVDSLFLMTPGGPVVIGWEQGKEPVLSEPPAPETQPAPAEVPPGEQPPALVAAQGATSSTTGPSPTLTKAAQDDLSRWRRKALKYQREGTLEKCRFDSEHIPGDLADSIADKLSNAGSDADVRAAFALCKAAEDEVDVPRLADNLEALLGAVREERGRREAFI